MSVAVLLRPAPCWRPRRHRSPPCRAGPPGCNVIDVKQPYLRLALENTDESAVDPVLEAERRKNRIEGAPDGHVLQLADERPADRRVGDHAQARAAHEEEQQVSNRHRLGERERKRAIVEIGSRQTVVNLGQRQRGHRGRCRRRGRRPKHGDRRDFGLWRHGRLRRRRGPRGGGCPPLRRRGRNGLCGDRRGAVDGVGSAGSLNAGGGSITGSSGLPFVARKVPDDAHPATIRATCNSHGTEQVAEIAPTSTPRLNVSDR